LSFSTLKLHPALIRGVDKLGFQHPSPIQSKAIPPALEGRDLLACAATGSGKTAAFLLPILHQLVDQPRGTTRALVLAPTRELACQIRDDLNALAQFTGLKSVVVHGGVAMGPQKTAFQRGTDVIIATPGRLLDHFQYHYAALSGLEYLVLDEADRMLDMGFLPDIRRVLKHVPKPKQIFFFSATMPAPIEKLTKEILKKPVRITLQRKAAPAEGVSHAAYPVLAKQRGALLVELLRRGHINDALVFTRTKHGANRLAQQLEKDGLSAAAIHGNKSQGARTRALAGFKNGDVRVLVATDIAARGIDVDGISHVINYDIPYDTEAYTHRIGRTGRAGREGIAIAFCDDSETDFLRDIEKLIDQKLELDDDHDWHFPEAIPTRENRGKGRAIQAERKKENDARRGPRGGGKRHQGGGSSKPATGSRNRGNRGSRGRGRSGNR